MSSGLGNPGRCARFKKRALLIHCGVFGISDFYADGRLDRAGSIPNLTAGEAKAAVSLRGMVDPRRATVELHPLMRFFPCWLLARVLKSSGRWTPHRDLRICHHKEFSRVFGLASLRDLNNSSSSRTRGCCNCRRRTSTSTAPWAFRVMTTRLSRTPWSWTRRTRVEIPSA